MPIRCPRRCRDDRFAVIVATTTALFTIAIATFAGEPPATEPIAEPTKVSAPRTAEIDEKARPILERAIAVGLGDHAEGRTLENVRVAGRLSMPGAGIEGTISVISHVDGRQAMEMEIPGLGSMRTGATKTYGWSFSELQGPAIQSDAEFAFTRAQSDPYGEANWATRATRIGYGGESEVELPDGTKRPSHVITLTLPGGETERHHFDREHGWRLRSDQEMTLPGGATAPITSWFYDHRPVDSMHMAHRTVVRVGPQSQELVLESIEINAKLADDTFVPPAEVRAIASR